MARHKFLLFFTASGKLGLGSVMLTAVFLVVGIAEHHRGENLSSFWFMCLAGACLLLGCYRAWNAEHEKLLAELKKNSKPEFQVDISRVFRDATPTQGIPWLDCGNTYVAKLSVVNVRPSPSSVQSVFVTLEDEGKRFAAERFSQRQLGWSRDGITRIFNGESVTQQIWKEETISDLLPSLAEPMVQGSHKDGWVYLTDLPSVNSSSLFKFYVVDAYGEPHGPFVPEAEMDHANVKRL